MRKDLGSGFIFYENENLSLVLRYLCMTVDRYYR